MMKKFLIILGLIVIVTGGFASGSIEDGSHWLPVEGTASNHIITDGRNYSISIDEIAAVQLYTSISAAIFLKGNDRPLYIQFGSKEETQNFIAEVYKRMAAIQIPKVK
jgi:hypothetical protein